MKCKACGEALSDDSVDWEDQFVFCPSCGRVSPIVDEEDTFASDLLLPNDDEAEFWEHEDFDDD